MTAFGILPRFTGVAVHDAYSGYDGFITATHACAMRTGTRFYPIVTGPH
jgi:hypothetical protein